MRYLLKSYCVAVYINEFEIEIIKTSSVFIYIKVYPFKDRLRIGSQHKLHLVNLRVSLILQEIMISEYKDWQNIYIFYYYIFLFSRCLCYVWNRLTNKVHLIGRFNISAFWRYPEYKIWKHDFLWMIIF